LFEVSARILVVDDDLQQRRSLSIGLRVEGFSPIEASGGEDAMRLLESQSVDLVITDLMMPGLNGLHFVRRLQARMPELPVILTSGYHLGRKQIERAGLRVLAFVPKPYDLAELSSFLHAKLVHREAG
jgi:DNA-binding NtrC family response regulator